PWIQRPHASAKPESSVTVASVARSARWPPSFGGEENASTHITATPPTSSARSGERSSQPSVIAGLRRTRSFRTSLHVDLHVRRGGVLAFRGRGGRRGVRIRRERGLRQVDGRVALLRVRLDERGHGRLHLPQEEAREE